MNPKLERPREDEDPFKDLKIGNWMILEDINERQLCQMCNKSRKYFCYNCYIPVQALQNHVPKVKLPIKIDIIKHSREIDGKSTAAHAVVLAPEDVNIFTYPCIPDYGSDERVVLIFPGKDAVSLESFFHTAGTADSGTDEPKPKRLNTGSQLPITKAVFIDSTWNQSRGIFKDQRLKGLPSVVLQTRISQFWRHQKGSPRWYLATIEAIHQFLVELHTAAWKSRCYRVQCIASEEKGSNVECNEHQEIPQERTSDTLEQTSVTNSNKSFDIIHTQVTTNDSLECFGPYNGEYDNLLFFFRYMYSKIHTLYDHDDLQAYKRPLK